MPEETSETSYFVTCDVCGEETEKSYRTKCAECGIDINICPSCEDRQKDFREEDRYCHECELEQDGDGGDDLGDLEGME